MQSTDFEEAINTLVVEDQRFHRDAYLFLRDALDSTIKSKKKSSRESAVSHVTVQELLDGFRKRALKDFGPMSRTVLEYWGVRNCQDIGQMVFNLIDAGVFRRTEQDTQEAFRDGYDFHEAFEVPFLPRCAPRSNEV